MTSDGYLGIHLIRKVPILIIIWITDLVVPEDMEGGNSSGGSLFFKQWFEWLRRQIKGCRFEMYTSRHWLAKFVRSCSQIIFKRVDLTLSSSNFIYLPAIKKQSKTVSLYKFTIAESVLLSLDCLSVMHSQPSICPLSFTKANLLHKQFCNAPPSMTDLLCGMHIVRLLLLLLLLLPLVLLSWLEAVQNQKIRKNGECSVLRGSVFFAQTTM